MKVLKNVKNEVLTLSPQNMDDIYTLYNIVKEGDFVSKKDTRKIKLEFKERTETKTKTLYLTLKVEGVEFHEYTGRLRISGILQGEDISGHHTFSVKENDVLTIRKDSWSKYELNKLKEAPQEQVTLVLMDREEAHIFETKPWGLEEASVINSNAPRKDDDTYDAAISKYFGEIEKQLRDKKNIIVAGPGFLKETFAKKYKYKSENASSATISGAHELIKNGVVNRFLKNERMFYEEKIVDDFLTEIKKDGKFSYGFESVKRAVQAGAVETLLLTTGKIKNERINESFENLNMLMKSAESKGGEVVIISSENNAGKKLDALGSIGAILRYKLE